MNKRIILTAVFLLAISTLIYSLNIGTASAGEQKKSSIHVLIFLGQHGNCSAGQSGAKVTLYWTCLGVNHQLTKQTDANGNVDFDEWCSDPGTLLYATSSYGGHNASCCGWTPPGSDASFSLCLNDINC